MLLVLTVCTEMFTNVRRTGECVSSQIMPTVHCSICMIYMYVSLAFTSPLHSSVDVLLGSVTIQPKHEHHLALPFLVNALAAADSALAAAEACTPALTVPCKADTSSVSSASLADASA